MPLTTRHLEFLLEADVALRAKHKDLGLAVYPIPLRTETKKSKHSLFFPFAASSITVRFYVYYTMQPNSTLVASDAYGASHPSSVNYFGLL